MQQVRIEFTRSASSGSIQARETRTHAGRLSLQMRHHRAEHWVVVRGTARAMIGDNVTFLHENKSTYVLSGARHRLENPGKIGLELIEVQTGS